ncbi:MAG TPA: glycosyltransferase [Mycobacteriales bacterium]|nr:glycosyltransferase [Mycobacteriales bacterium]
MSQKPSAPRARLRVMHVLEAIFGGTATHLCDLVTVTRDVDHIVVVPSQRFGQRTDELAVQMLREAGAEVHVIDMRRTPTHPDNLFAFFRLVKLMHKTRPDVVHGHSSVGGALARAAALMVPRTPTVWTPNGLLTSSPVLTIERMLSRVTAATIAVSESEAELISRKGLDKCDEVLVIPNGIDLDHVPDPRPMRDILGIPEHAPVVGTVIRLVPQKAPLDFIDCCQKIHEARPDTHFVLVGDGPLQDQVDARLATWEHGGHFHQVPYLPDVSGLLEICDLFVMLSRYEGAPYAPLEAMRAGVPVILTDVVGSRDVVEDGATGILVQPGDSTAAANAAVRLLDSAEDRGLMSKAAYLRLYRVFDRELQGEAHSELYHRLAGVERVRTEEPFPSSVDVLATSDARQTPVPAQTADTQPVNAEGVRS